MNFPKNVTVFNHPLINHKIAILRSETTGMKEFRELVEEITTLMAFESLKDIPTTEIDVQTPLELCRQTVVQEKSVVVVPVLRAGTTFTTFTSEDLDSTITIFREGVN